MAAERSSRALSLAGLSLPAAKVMVLTVRSASGTHGMATANGTLPLTSHQSQTAQRILDAAAHLFSEHGLGGTSIQAVADVARVSKANVFHHFANKLTLYRAVLERKARGIHRRTQTLTDTTIPMGERLKQFVATNLDSMLADPESVNLFIRGLMDPRPSRTRNLVEEAAEQTLRLVTEALETCRRTEDLPRETDVSALAVALLGANLTYFQLRNVVSGTGARLGDPTNFADGISALFSGALTAAPRDRSSAT